MASDCCVCCGEVSLCSTSPRPLEKAGSNWMACFCACCWTIEKAFTKCSLWNLDPQVLISNFVFSLRGFFKVNMCLLHSLKRRCWHFWETVLLTILKQVCMISFFCSHCSSVCMYHRWGDNSMFIIIFTQWLLTETQLPADLRLQTHSSLTVHALFQKPCFIPKSSRELPP